MRKRGLQHIAEPAELGAGSFPGREARCVTPPGAVLRGSLALLLTVLLAGATGSAPVEGAPAHSGARWRCGGLEWRLEPGDLTAYHAARRVLSLRHMLFPGGAPGNGFSTFESRVRPLSIAGRILCFRQDDYWEGGAHPSGSISYGAVEVGAGRSPRRLSLTDLFPDAEVRDALWNDPVIRKIAQRKKLASSPRSASALVEALKWEYFGGAEGYTYGIPEDLLFRFAFHSLAQGGKRVAVRLCVPWGSEVYRFRHTELGLLLRVPPRLSAPLSAAAAGREGFLMANVPPQARPAATLVNSGP
jgi:hypothetical protein